MAGKSLMPYIGSSSNSTYNLEGETPANQVIPVENYTMEGGIHPLLRCPAPQQIWSRPANSLPIKARRLFQDDDKATPPPAERYVGTLYTKAGDEELHNYITPTATPSTPKEDWFCIRRVRTPGGAAESRCPPPMTVKRHLTPPPIVRALGQFQEEEVKSPEPSVHKLAAQVKKLRKENIELRDRNAELGVELAELRNNFDTLSRGSCARSSVHS
uniref:Uncharacterized protein n=1 Tax=Oryza sativa subsp. japonica TaxID=39947 RepID=Q84T46_ORYSJ|nr:hypothetical protein [Oryza sativa Japonica Group]